MIHSGSHDRSCRLRASRAVIFAFSATTALATPASFAEQTSFASPESAVERLIGAIRSGNTARMVTILGPESKTLIQSGDPVADRNSRRQLLAEYDDVHQITNDEDGRAVLVIGKDQWRFPFPLVKSGKAWRFDSSAGAQEILDRRISGNELGAMEVCRAYVAAQREYASKDRNHDGYVEYAQQFLSSPNRHDGLYWPSKPGEEQSPLGPLVASARAEGYSSEDGGSARTPYQGYYYKILTAQGPAAKDGAYDYIVKGHMIGGFALVAFPAQYGVSGIMTFITNHDGIIYEKDLGDETGKIARSLTEFNPDPSWKSP